MKFWLFIFLSLFLFVSCGNTEVVTVMETIRIVEEYYPEDTVKEATAEINEDNRKDDGTVYICTGKGAKSYHRTQSCPALGRCKSEIKAVDMAGVKRMGRRPCKRCVQPI